MEWITKGRASLATGAIAAAVALGAIVATPAIAATASMSPGNATLQSGQSRGIGVAWGDKGPYNVTFKCNVAGCSNYTSASTSTGSLGRTVQTTTCTGLTATHTVSVKDASGGSASAKMSTTWTRGTVC